MAIAYHDQHLADVNESLGLRAPRKNSLRYGWEIEIGWQEKHQRQAFLDYLADKTLKSGLRMDQVVIAKHDGTIDSRWPCELVSKPMEEFEVFESLEVVGDAIEKFSKLGLITEHCGIHFHVSKDATANDAIWRATNAICIEETRNRKSTGHEEVREPHPSEAILSQFWSQIALRKSTNHCGRQKYSSFQEFSQSKGNHRQAIIVGRSTPTYEFRIFRATRSKRVLVSYFESILALLRFCGRPADEFCTKPQEIGNGLKLEDLKPYPTNWVYHNDARTGEHEVWDRTTGAVIGRHGDRTAGYYTMNDGMIWYPAAKIMRKHRVQPPMLTWETGRQNSGAREFRNMLIEQILETNQAPDPSCWINGFPLKAFFDYVEKEEKSFPTLAKRLRLSKFTDFFVEPEKFDTSVPHLEFRSGCLVYDENAQTHITLTKVIPAEDPMQSVCMGIIAENRDEKIKKGIVWKSSMYHLTHSCPGALETGGEQ